MSVLALLEQAPCLGSQLRFEFDRRTGMGWPVNAGQIYSTLDRLERDGLVVRGAALEGQSRYSITPLGSAEVARWMTTAEAPRAERDELAIKVALLSSLPGADAMRTIRVQRDATTAELHRLSAESDALEEAVSAEEVAAALILDGQRIAAEGQLRWLELCELRLGRAAAAGVDPLPVAHTSHKRGRPAKVTVPLDPTAAK
jgi:DNA-binding PadR family transcriptional regulator